MQVWSLGREDPLEEEMTTHSSILAWRIPWTEEPVGYSPKSYKEPDTTERLTTPLEYKLFKGKNSFSILFAICIPSPWTSAWPTV